MTSLTWKNTTKASTLTAQIDPSTWFELEALPNGAANLWIVRKEPRTKSEKQGFRVIVYSAGPSDVAVERAQAYAELFLASPWEIERYGL